MARKRDLARRVKAASKATKAAKRPAGPKRGKVTPRQAERALSSKRSPRSQTLPGMEKIRSKPLDNLCEGIGDCRATKNAATTEERGFERSALKVMQTRGLSVYKHAGVELALVPGSDKLRVRLTSEKGDAAVMAGASVEPSESEIHDEDAYEAGKVGDGSESTGDRDDDADEGEGMIQ